MADNFEVAAKATVDGLSIMTKARGMDEDEAFHNASVKLAEIADVAWVPVGDITVVNTHLLEAN